jgi:hypothetical protein
MKRIDLIIADQDLRRTKKAAVASCLAGPRIIFPFFREVTING